MIYDQDDPEVPTNATQCSENIGKIFYRQCPNVTVEYSGYCEEHTVPDDMRED